MLAENTNCPYLGSVPIDPILTTCTDSGQSFIESLKGSVVYAKFKEITDKLVSQDGKDKPIGQDTV